MLHAIQLLLQRTGLALARDILAAFQQLFGEFQLLTVLDFQFVEADDKVIFFLLDGGQAHAVALVADGDIFQQRLPLHIQGGYLCANAGQLFRHSIKAHTYARSRGVQ
ncbi:hypothetical protein D3C80_1469320 [compost metagenome]